MNDLSLHLAPNAPALWLILVSLGLVALSVWAYRFAIPPLPELARRALPAIRILALIALAWLLAQPVLERARAGRAAHLVVLLDTSRSMDLPARPGGASRAREAETAVAGIENAWRGRASVRVLPFSARLGGDSLDGDQRGATAMGDALAALQQVPEGQELDGVVVVSDGVVNAGRDPLAAARMLGVPVHTVLSGSATGINRSVTEVEASTIARVGETTPVRVRVASSEPRGTALTTRLLDGNDELARATVPAPGPGLESVVDLRVTPRRPGLAVWTARVDSLHGESSLADDARQVAIEVAPGRLGVLIVSAGLNWDLAFLRRALLGDSGVSVRTIAREEGGWREVESNRPVTALGEADLRNQAVVILDGMAAAEAGASFEAGVEAFLRSGGGLLALAGGQPGLLRFRTGRLGAQLGFELDPTPGPQSGTPAPSAEAAELLAWDDDPQRGAQAWRAAAPLSDLTPVTPGGGDRVLIASQGGGPPLLIARHVGRGQVMFVNGTGLWRWSLTSHDDLSAERGRRLWRRLIRWLAEPVQGEPLRVKPERWLSGRGEPVRIFASLQGADFKPVGGATLAGEARAENGRTVRFTFTPRATGSYEAVLNDPGPGRYRISVRASRGGAELGSATSEFAVDRWSLEEARAEPDSATMAALAAASGGRATTAASAAAWARSLPARAMARPRSDSLRLWESPWVFALVVGLLSCEWIWRRRRGLP